MTLLEELEKLSKQCLRIIAVVVLGAAVFGIAALVGTALSAIFYPLT